MPQKTASKTVEIASLVLTIRGMPVVLEPDLARIFGIPTPQLHRQFTRHLEKSSPDFAFRLTPREVAELRSQAAPHRRFGRAPRVFTEHGALLLAGLLHRPAALAAASHLARAFVQLREPLARLTARVNEHDEAISNLCEAIRQLVEPAPSADAPLDGLLRDDANPYRIRRYSRN
jgi:hypothetical protein